MIKDTRELLAHLKTGYASAKEQKLIGAFIKILFSETGSSSKALNLFQALYGEEMREPEQEVEDNVVILRQRFALAIGIPPGNIREIARATSGAYYVAHDHGACWVRDNVEVSEEPFTSEDC